MGKEINNQEIYSLIILLKEVINRFYLLVLAHTKLIYERERKSNLAKKITVIRAKIKTSNPLRENV